MAVAVAAVKEAADQSAQRPAALLVLSAHVFDGSYHCPPRTNVVMLEEFCQQVSSPSDWTLVQQLPATHPSPPPPLGQAGVQGVAGGLVGGGSGGRGA